jgi:hypothetical protein
MRRNLTDFASNAVSQHRRSAQALLTLASPSTQVSSGSAPRCSVTFLLWLLVTNHSLLSFSSVLQILSTLHDYIQGDQVGSQGSQTGPPKNELFNLSRHIPLNSGALALV